jgi:hypothetical protein
VREFVLRLEDWMVVMVMTRRRRVVDGEKENEEVVVAVTLVEGRIEGL